MITLKQNYLGMMVNRVKSEDTRGERVDNNNYKMPSKSAHNQWVSL